MLKRSYVLTVLATGMAFAQGDQTARIAKEVRHELVTLPFLDVFDNLTYPIDGHTVVLQGQVTRPTLKTDVERVVKGIEAVEKVDNRIEVLLLSS